jgi:16S rRNA (cytidine1402-2'-O)-methyltransferase
MCVARELTKQFEEFRRGTAGELLAHFTAHAPRGEIVLILSGLSKKERREQERD